MPNDTQLIVSLVEEAEAYFSKALETTKPLSNRWLERILLIDLAHAAYVRGDFDKRRQLTLKAALLWGAAERHHISTWPWSQGWRRSFVPIDLHLQKDARVGCQILLPETLLLAQVLKRPTSQLGSIIFLLHGEFRM